MYRKMVSLLSIVAAVVFVLLGGGLWFASNQLLFPVWHGLTKDWSQCSPEAQAYFGKGCGNLRSTQSFRFSEVRVPSVNGYQLPGWLVRTADNGGGSPQGAVMLIPAGGSDKREVTRYIQFFLNRHLDILALDLGCQGEAPCPVPGLSYGQRESEDVFSAYVFLTDRYARVYAMGSSVGAASILIALPAMPKLTAVIAENPTPGFQNLIRDATESQSMPNWATDFLMQLAMFRGHFDGLLSPEESLRFARTTPIFFIHSKADKIVSYKQTQELANLYAGRKTTWFPENGSHAEIWDVDHATYENKLADFINGAQ